MKARLWLPAIAIFGVPALLWCQGPAVPALPSPGQSRFVGAGSCAAAACHNNPLTPGAAGSEYTTWITQDRHAKAYEVLFEARSGRIQKSLGSDVPAHQEQRCLRCHVAPGIDASLEKKAPYLRTDGVSCESCHGAAEKWLNVHHLPAWQAQKPADKKSLGMNDTQSLVGRAQVCVACHVGAAGMEVDHDLIAAGHPRLAFELTAFHAFMPSHWPDAKDRDPTKSPRGRTDFEARAWIVGQLVTAQAALELLADRAGDAKKPWPEFARHDCVACHHVLQSPSPQPQRGGKPGAVPWSDWDIGLTQIALQAIKARPSILANLHKELNKGWNNRQAIARSARLSARQLKASVDQVERQKVDFGEALGKILAEVSPRATHSGDDSVQVGLAWAALHRSQIDRQESFPAAHRLAIQQFAAKLTLPKGYQRSTGIDPDAVRMRLLEFKNLGARKGF